MSNIKDIPEWKQYEWLISKIFHDDLASIDIKVLPDAKITGQYSERSRQIDILVNNNGIKTIIECKHHSIPLDVKDIESFIGMFNDVGADNGIMISSNGFSKTAKNRINEFKTKIKLEHIEWEKAYENSFQAESYGRIKDLCEYCNNHSTQGTEVPGLLLWNGGYALEKNSIIWRYDFAKCLKCDKYTIYCDSCGVTYVVGEDEHCCQEALEFQNYLENITNQRSQ